MSTTTDEPRQRQTRIKSWGSTKIESSDAPVARKPRKKKLATKIIQPILRLTRRVHLYSGLAMFPWVILYGFTALLFNRPTTLPDAEIVHLDPPRVEGSVGLPEVMARQIVASLNEAERARMEPGDQAERPRTFQFINSKSAHFTSKASWSMEQDERQITLVTNLNDRSGYVRIKEEAEKAEEGSVKDDLLSGLEALEFESESVNSAMLASIRAAIPDLDLSEEQLANARIPTLEFDLEIDGEIHTVRFSTSRSNSRGRPPANRIAPTTSVQVSADERKAMSSNRPPRPPILESEAEQGVTSELATKNELVLPRSGTIRFADQPSNTDMSWRRYLLRLHTAHGYPVEKNARWFWAIVVDMMFASMVFWGMSGIVMWWQIKRTRGFGAIVVLGSGVAAAWLAISMHAEMMQ